MSTLSNELQSRVYSDFSNGWNPDAVLGNVADNELVDARNCIPNERGGISKRMGTALVNVDAYDANPIKRVYELGKPGSPLNFINASGTTLRKSDGTVIAAGLAGIDFDVEAWGSASYFVNGTKMYKWDYAVWAEAACAEAGADLAPVHRCKYLHQRGSRMFAAGDPTNPNTVFVSQANNPVYFKGLTSVIAMTDDDDVITGMYTVGEGSESALAVFKKRSIFAWYGWDPSTDVQWHKQPASAGTISDRTICQVGNMVYYAGENGVYRVYSVNPGQMASECISDPKPGGRPGVSTVYDRLINKSNMCAVFWKRYYMLACQDGTSPNANNRVLVFDVALDRWLGYFTLNVSDWCIRSDGTLVFGSSTTGRVMQFGVGYHDHNDAGVNIPIEFNAETKHFDMGEEYKDKKIKRMFLAGKQYLAESSTVDVTIKTDYQSAHYAVSLDESLVWDEGLWGEGIWGWIDIVTKMLDRVRHKGKHTHVIFNNNVIDEPVTIYGVCFIYRTKRAKANKSGVTRVEVVE